MSISDLATAAFWAEVADRAGRQACQTALPIVAAIVSSNQPFNAEALVIAVSVAVAVTVLKGLTGLMLHPEEAWYWQLVDRAVPAAAGVLLGFVPVDYADVIHVNWAHAGSAALAAGVVALLAFYVTPPAGRSTAQDTGGLSGGGSTNA